MPRTMPELAEAIATIFTGSPKTLANPYPGYRELRDAGAMHWLPAATGGGPWANAWHVLGYDEVAMGLKERRLGAHRMPAPPPSPCSTTPAQRDAAELGRIFGLTLLYLDPPDHTRLRLLTAQTFTRRVGDTLRPRMEQMVDALLDGIAARDTFDVVADLATPLPNQVVAELLGIPAADQATLAQRSGGIMTPRPTPQAMANALELVRYFRDLLPRYRADPGDDLISDLVRARDENDALTDDEVIAQCMSVVIAGTETTTAAIATGVLALLDHPTIWEALSAQTVSAVVEELLRFAGPTHLLPREAREELEIGGQRIRSGQRLWLWLAAANRDPVRFVQADELVLERSGSRHLAFGSGMHACIGAALARLELEVALLHLRQRFPELRCADAQVSWSPNPAIRCPAHLRVSHA